MFVNHIVMVYMKKSSGKDMKSILLPLILMPAILSIISCNISKHREAEPNNTFAAANVVETGKIYTGTIESDKDIDCFVFNADRDRIIRIELTGVKGVNHAISIFRMDGETGTLLKLIDDNRKSSPEDFANLFVSQGKYIISVHHGERDEKKGNPDTQYNLKITDSDTSAEEHEPNDKQKPNIIQPDYPLTGFFSPARDRNNDDSRNQFREEDWFSFELTADENTPLTVSLDLSGVSGVDSVLELYDEQFNMIAQSDTALHGSGESITDFGIKKSGVYYAVAAAKNFQYNNNSRYTISLVVNSHDQGTELEPNNSFEEANIITGTEIRGKSNSRQDIDYFATDQLHAKKNVRIELIDNEYSDTTLTVYDSAKKKLFEINNAGPGESETVPALYVKDRLYLAVTSKTEDNPDAAYILNVSEINSFNQVEVEPNNRKEDANTVQVNNIIKGFTTTGGDVDYFIITNDFRKNYRIEIRAPLNGTIKISTTDQSGYIIKSKDLRNGETAGLNEIFEKKGYIIIETVVSDFNNSYDLLVEEIR